MSANHCEQPSNKIWRNDITGLRALAVLPVLFYHAFPQFLPGGFFGVDVFFVISGYLISGIIFRDLKNENFSYLVFYRKRIKRIIPNLILLLIFVSVVGYLFLLPSESKALAKQIVASTLFIQNFQLLSEFGYFTEDALRQPLLHLWSLAIEEQFYIIFPLIVPFVWKVAKGWNVRVIGGICGLLFFSSLIACVAISDKGFSFYFPLTRFWEIGAGIVLAYQKEFLNVDGRRFPSSVKNIISIIGLISFIGVIFFCDSVGHPGLITLIPVVAATFLIMAGPDGGGKQVCFMQ